MEVFYMNENRIKVMREALNLNQQELADMANVSLHTIFRAEKGTNVQTKNLRAIATALNTSVAYLMGETDDPHYIPIAGISLRHNVQSNATLRDDTIHVPIISSEISACCGNGHNYPEDVNWEVIGSYPILPEDVLAYEWQVGKKGFAIIKADGDSMEPQIEDGERVIFAKCPDTKPANGNFVLLKWDDRLMIRGYTNYENDITLIPVNKIYEEIKTKKGDKRLCIIGVVIGKVPPIKKLTGLY